MKILKGELLVNEIGNAKKYTYSFPEGGRPIDSNDDVDNIDEDIYLSSNDEISTFFKSFSFQFMEDKGKI